MDRDIETVEGLLDGAIILPGTFPVHDLADLDIGYARGSYTTVAGLVLERLGHIPAVGETADMAGRCVTVLEVEGRAITRVRVDASHRPEKRHASGRGAR